MTDIKLKGPEGNIKPKTMNREAVLRKDQRREAILKQAINSLTGLKKVAASLSNPVRRKLDYIGICRKFLVTELWPVGMPIIFDRDVEEFTGVVVGKNGSLRYIEIEVERVELTPYEIVVNPRIPYRELYDRLYQVVKRAKERIEQAMALREDLIYFAALDTAALAYHPSIAVPTYLTKDVLARSMTPIEFERLVPQNILMTAHATQGIRRWQYQDLDDTARAEVRDSGYLGTIWGTQMYTTDQLTAGNFYIMASPEFHGWMPFRKEVEILPADVPWDLVLGFVAYEYLALTIHNVRSAVKGTFAVNV